MAQAWAIIELRQTEQSAERMATLTLNSYPATGARNSWVRKAKWD